MAYYLVKASIKNEAAEEFYNRLHSDEFKKLRPFGKELTRALKNARHDPETRQAVWEEEDYCSPPLAQEREAVLDQYFTGLNVEQVDKNEGWNRIRHLPSLWDELFQQDVD